MDMKEYIKCVVIKIKNDIRTAAIPLIMLTIYYFVTKIRYGLFCPYRIVVGRLCPGCGLTHSCTDIILFRFKEAWQYNAAGFAWVPFIIYVVIFRYFTNRKPKLIWLFCIITCLITIMQWLLLRRFAAVDYFN